MKSKTGIPLNQLAAITANAIMTSANQSAYGYYVSAAEWHETSGVLHVSHVASDGEEKHLATIAFHVVDKNTIRLIFGCGNPIQEINTHQDNPILQRRLPGEISGCVRKVLQSWMPRECTEPATHRLDRVAGASR